jgi:hypothetical protein
VNRDYAYREVEVQGGRRPVDPGHQAEDYLMPVRVELHGGDGEGHEPQAGIAEDPLQPFEGQRQDDHNHQQGGDRQQEPEGQAGEQAQSDHHAAKLGDQGHQADRLPR